MFARLCYPVNVAVRIQIVLFKEFQSGIECIVFYIILHSVVQLNYHTVRKGFLVLKIIQ